MAGDNGHVMFIFILLPNVGQEISNSCKNIDRKCSITRKFLCNLYLIWSQTVLTVFLLYQYFTDVLFVQSGEGLGVELVVRGRGQHWVTLHRGGDEVLVQFCFCGKFSFSFFISISLFPFPYFPNLPYLGVFLFVPNRSESGPDVSRRRYEGDDETSILESRTGLQQVSLIMAVLESPAEVNTVLFSVEAGERGSEENRG